MDARAHSLRHVVVLSATPAFDVLKQVAFGILVSMGPRTLARTLLSYREAGLLDRLGQLLVFVQVRPFRRARVSRDGWCGRLIRMIDAVDFDARIAFDFDARIARDSW